MGWEGGREVARGGGSESVGRALERGVRGMGWGRREGGGGRMVGRARDGQWEWGSVRGDG